MSETTIDKLTAAFAKVVEMEREHERAAKAASYARNAEAVAPIKAADDDYDITHTVPAAERVRGKAKVRFVKEPETLPYW